MGMRSTNDLYIVYELKQKWKEARRKELESKGKLRKDVVESNEVVT